MVDDYRIGPRFRFTLSIGGRPVVTEALLGINVLVWILLELVGGSTNTDVLLDFGAMSSPIIADGEYWRLFTAMFLHAGAMHIFFNGLTLFIFGRIVERAYGHVRFILVYVLAGLFGSVASFSLNSTGVGAGASGAIFGVIGALAAYFVANRQITGEMGRQNLMGLLVLVGINLLFGLSTPGIDNWAHIAGLASGFLLGMALTPSYREVIPTGAFEIPVGRPVDVNRLARRWYVVPIAVAVLLAALWAGLAIQPETALSHVLKAERLIESQDYEMAFYEIRKALHIDGSYGEAYLMLGRAHARLGNVERAQTALGRAFALARSEESRREALSLLISLGQRR